ncbi:CAP domain-containing protein [Deinococcus detaillensis]|uniref:CAP domain-containing protein n=1 Tax=Deinococcus detaillensis TaxID=2592048 RepID=A0A553V6J4_9DEIO|nr:CAP domain-containing protein [Deinococcus detaillensis]TSA88100.1 CAP domain-containing protein [Deinococcus detaillensis]
MKTPLTFLTIGFFALALTACGGANLPSPSAGAGAAVGSSEVSGGLGANSSKDAGPQDMTAEERMVLEQTNKARAVARTCGGQSFAAAGPLTWNGYLAKSARAHSQDMADKSYFSHVGLDGSTMIKRDEAAGYSAWQELGENIAAGYAIAVVVQGWIDSPSHCKTLMDPKYKELGVGYVYKQGTQYGTYWTQEYGTR